MSWPEVMEIQITSEYIAVQQVLTPHLNYRDWD